MPGLHRRIPADRGTQVNSALAANRALKNSVAALRADGVRVLLGPGEFEPHPPGTGDTRLAGYPWHLALQAL